MSNKPWEDYKFEIPSNGDMLSNGGVQFKKVLHVTPVEEAIRIIEDNEIRPSLLKDKTKGSILSTLREKGASVIWLSPKNWPQSIYGNVEFVFDWKTINTKNIYWVGVKQYARTTACRFLFTDRDMSKFFEPYDPINEHGPLREISGEWYFSNKRELVPEFLMELDNLQLSDCKEINFKDHIKKNKNGNMIYIKDKFSGGGEMLAHIIGNGIYTLNNYFRENNEIKDNAVIGIIGICKKLIGKNINYANWGSINNNKDCEIMLYGALSLLIKNDSKSKKLLSLIGSKNVFQDAFREIIEDYFKINTFQKTVNEHSGVYDSRDKIHKHLSQWL